MIKLKEFNKYRENNKLEVKNALNGLPNSIWETYSSFSNSYGGTILLGVNENSSKRLITSGLNEIQAHNLVKSFWDTINNPNKISLNLLKDKDVKIHRINEAYIVEINIPESNRKDRPIYLNNNLLQTYRRNYEGDYKCTKIEIKAMLRDQDEKSNDSYLIENMDLSIINQETLDKYRIAYNQHHKEDHLFVKEDNEKFLIHIGAARIDANGIIRPTKAGLLMFGNFYDITNIYPNYFLDYQDHRNLSGDDMRWSFRITSTYGDWSGNLFDFYYRIAFKITEDIAVPFKMKGIFRDDSSKMKKALREALCNTLSNADYNNELGLVIKQYHDRIEFSNPGILASPMNQIMQGGDSHARNKYVLNMFSFVNIGERAGSGIPLIMKATQEEHLPKPKLYDEFNPDRTKLIIYINNCNQKPDVYNKNLGNEDKKPNIEDKKPNIEDEKPNIEDKKADILESINSSLFYYNVKFHLRIICDRLFDSIFSRKNIVEIINCGKTQATEYIKILFKLNLIEPVYGHGKGKYKFKK